MAEARNLLPDQPVFNALSRSYPQTYHQRLCHNMLRHPDSRKGLTLCSDAIHKRPTDHPTRCPTRCPQVWFLMMVEKPLRKCLQTTRNRLMLGLKQNECLHVGFWGTTGRQTEANKRGSKGIAKPDRTVPSKVRVRASLAGPLRLRAALLLS